MLKITGWKYRKKCLSLVQSLRKKVFTFKDWFKKDNILPVVFFFFFLQVKTLMYLLNKVNKNKFGHK